MSPQRSFRRIIPVLLTIAVMGGSISTASALGKSSKPWQRKAKTKVERSQTPTANVASSTTKKRSRLFGGRVRETRPAAPATTRRPLPVQVRGTTVGTKPDKKRRAGLLARIFNPELRRDRREGNVAVSRRANMQPNPAPNPVQAPPKYNHALISQAKSRGSKVVVNISAQRAYVYVAGEVAVDTPVSTARSGKRTPRGSFGVGEKVRQGKISTIYHVAMPYWMRLGSSAYGMHAGYLPGYPASAGCIRMPNEAAQKVYDCVSHGTRVQIIGG
jgi:lipoprotein-anchoring transpeptidase ErfK/SrfK